MVLFHVSFREYEVGQSYTAPNPNGYHQRAILKGEDWINTYLDENKPIDFPSRISSFYACDEIVNCQAFIGNKTINGQKPIYYKVEMNCEIGFPMVLTDAIKKNEQNSPHLINCSNEYWSPSGEWKYKEFLSPEMTILEILPNPDSICANKGRMNYNADLERAKRDFIR